MVNVSILDGYIDEPTCLGVPPYISPYPRYIAGSIWDYDSKSNINYFTIDQLRNDSSIFQIISKSDIFIVVSGSSVPGRYLAGYPISPNELFDLVNKIHIPLKILCGPAAKHGFGTFGGKKTRDITEFKGEFDLIIKGDPEIVLQELLKNKCKIDFVDDSACRENSDDIKDVAVKGAKIITQHPGSPDYLISEVETYRGCSRSIVGGCSFCSEPLKGPPDFRSIKSIIKEISELYSYGLKNFRIGNQPCIFSYMANNANNEEFPKPNPESLEKLFSGIRSVAPQLKTLHIDNANPGIVAHYPTECEKIGKTIVKYHTSGDVAAFGVESTDPDVIKCNNLKASSEDVYTAIKLINKIGSQPGNNGLPELLPGLNFLFGLKGETKKTFKMNYDFLKKILDDGLLVRRINLRQVIPIPSTLLYENQSKNIIKYKKEFQRFKRKVKENIERPLLIKLLPKDTVLTSLYSELYKGKLTFGRQIGSYPLLVGIPGIIPLNTFLDVKVVDYGFRSITAIPYPLDINRAEKETIEILPGVGKKRANRIINKRPFNNKDDFILSLDDPKLGEKLLEYISF